MHPHPHPHPNHHPHPKLTTLTRRRALVISTQGLIATVVSPFLRTSPARAANAGSGPIADGKPVTLIVSYPAGGGADLMARLIAPGLSQALGQSVVVDNKPGASGQLAAAAVARAKPDGTTLLLDASSFAVNPALFAKLPYDSASAFTPLAILALYPNVLVCTPSFAAQNVKDVVRLAKAGQVAYASSGNGSAQHLAGALFEQLAGVKMLHVPYKGGGPAMNDVMAGQVPLFFANVASSLGQINAGKLRPLAVTSRRRARSLPTVPTMEEAGVTGYEVHEWNPVLAPAGLPIEVKHKLQAAIRVTLAEPEVLGRIRSLSGELFPEGSDAALASYLSAQTTLWRKVIRERSISVD
jgi:tripartite-type tricarboxylate transporter receptor subunit TctC